MAVAMQQIRLVAHLPLVLRVIRKLHVAVLIDNLVVMRRRRKPMTTSINRIGLAKAALGVVLALALGGAVHAQMTQSSLVRLRLGVGALSPS